VDQTPLDKLARVLGTNLRAIRQSRGLTQEQFARLLEIQRTYMGGVERGERNLTLKTVERMAQKLGMTPHDLLGGEALDGSNPPEVGRDIHSPGPRAHA
jgi:transcriptional regulator with XRE-family HTH domain